MVSKIMAKIVMVVLLLICAIPSRAVLVCHPPSFTDPASQWDGIAGKPVGGQTNEFATLPANTTYSTDGITCEIAVAPTDVWLEDVPMLFILRTATLQTIPVSFRYDYATFDSSWGVFINYVPIPARE
jgi:hypothetical protein